MNVRFSLAGLILVALGVLLLLGNLNLYHFDWNFVLRLWPILLILFGLKYIFGEKGAGWASIIAIILILGFLFIVDAFGLNSVSLITKPELKSQTITENYSASYETAKLSLNLGAGNFNIENSTNNLIDINSETTLGEYNLNKNTSDKNINLNLSLNSKRHFWLSSINNENSAIINLNTTPIWTIDSKIGASNVNFDFSEYKISASSFEIGAANAYIKYGDKTNVSSATFDTGASKVSIDIPKSSGCEAKFDVGISAKYLTGFEQKSDSIYRTTNFDSATNKIYLNFKAGVSSLNIDQY
jgi:hypothetical protein